MIKTFRENLKFYRNEKDLSQEALSRQCHYDKTYVGKIERGDTNPSVEAVLRIADALDVSVTKLFQADVPTTPEDFKQEMETPPDRVGKLFIDVFLTSPSICFLTNNDGEILHLNRTAEKFLKADANDMIGRSISELSVWSQADVDPSILRELLELGTMKKTATRRTTMRYKGSERDLQFQVSFAGVPDGTEEFVIFQVFFVEETHNRTVMGDHFDQMRSV